MQRTIDALSDLSLIIISRRVPAGGTKPVNHYRIVWSELLMLCSKRRAAILPREGERQQDYLSEQQDFSAEQEDYSCDQQDFFYEQQDLKSPNLITSRSINPSPTSNLDVPKKEEEELNNSLARLGSTDSILDRLVEEYSRESVYGAAELLGRAMHRVGAEYLERLLAYYRDRSGAWGPGALRNRVKHSQPGLAIDAGWPSPGPRHRRLNRRPQSLDRRHSLETRTFCNARPQHAKPPSTDPAWPKNSGPGWQSPSVINNLPTMNGAHTNRCHKHQLHIRKNHRTNGHVVEGRLWMAAQ